MWTALLVVRALAAVCFTIPPIVPDGAPSWEALKKRVAATSVGQKLLSDEGQRAVGRGPPHTEATLRLFDSATESDVRVTFFRDDAAWCPYCQRCWLVLEEKRIPYRVRKLPLNAYGLKPSWFTKMVDGGKLPAVELDGKLHVESQHIIRLLDATFPQSPRMVPAPGSADEARTADLLRLSSEIERDWFSLVFYPVEEGEALERAQAALLASLRRLDDALASTPGSWMLGGEHASYAGRCLHASAHHGALNIPHRWGAPLVRRRADDHDHRAARGECALLEGSARSRVVDGAGALCTPRAVARCLRGAPILPRDQR